MAPGQTTSPSRRVSADELKRLVQEIFAKAGSDPNESERMAHYLIEANLAGHDSHGAIRVSYYVDYIRNGQVIPNQHAEVLFSSDTMLIIDGGSGFGQVVAEEAMERAIELSAKSGVALLALRNCGHIGRVGDWPMMAAQAGKVSLHFVNTSGFGILVAPFGGIDRRLSANPIAVGIPRQKHEPIVLDISTCAIAEGKIKVARNKGVDVPVGCIIDSNGLPTVDPKEFYANPPGAILPFGGHKGYGLGIVTEILAGAITGSGCSKPDADRLLNGMLAIIIDPEKMPTETPFLDEIDQFIEFVKSARRVSPENEILLPGEIESRTRRDRIAGGIPLDEQTRAELRKTGESLGLSREVLGIV